MSDTYSTLPTHYPSSGANSAPASTSTTNYARGGLTFSRRFSKAGLSPYDEVQWEKRTASITDASGQVDL